MATTAPNMLQLKAQPRKAAGKSEARRVRRSGMVPAVAYGKGLPTTSISVAPKDVIGVLKSELGKNTVIELEMDVGAPGAANEKRTLVAMIRDYALHPIARQLEHVDFVEVKLDKPVDVEVPLVPIGKPVGVTTGGVLRVVYRLVPVRCLPTLIPAKIEVEVSHLELGMAVPAQELKLPEGVAVRLPPEQTVVAVVAPEKEEVEEAAPGAVPGAVPGAAAVAGAPGAPGAPGAAPAAAAPAAEAAKEDKKGKK